MRAADTAAALGGAQRSGDWWRCRCPAHSSRSSSLALRDGERRLIVYCHAGCPREAVLNALRLCGLLDPFSPHAARDNNVFDDKTHALREIRDRKFRIACALDRWRHETRPAAGSVVEKYWHCRGLTLPLPSTIRASAGWLRHRESGETRPAMIALVEHVEHGPVAIHVTWLATDGSHKATLDPVRKCFGPVAGGAVRLGAAVAGDELVVGEGIETTAAVMQAIGLAGWAALSDGGLARLVLPPEIRRVLVACDHDANGAGERAARTAAQRWLAEGRRVRIALPPAPGTDFNDFLKEKNNGGRR